MTGEVGCPSLRSGRPGRECTLPGQRAKPLDAVVELIGKPGRKTDLVTTAAAGVYDRRPGLVAELIA